MLQSRQKLYGALSKDFDLGTQEEFNSKMDNPESRKKLYNSVSKDFDLGTLEDFESKVSNPTLKKKENLQPTVPKKNSESVGENTSSATANNPFKNKNIPGQIPAPPEKTKEQELSDYLGKVKVTPQNMGEVSLKTAELDKIHGEKTYSAKAIKLAKDIEKEPDFLQKYQGFKQNYLTASEEDKANAQKDLESELNTNQVTDYLKKGAGKVINAFANLAFNWKDDGKKIDVLGTEQKPLEESKKEAEEYFQEEKKLALYQNKPIPKFTPQDLEDKAKEIFLNKRQKSYTESRQNQYLQELDDKDGGILQSKFAKFKEGELSSLSESEKKLLNQQEVQKITYERLSHELENINKTYSKEKLTPEKIDYLNEKVSQVKQLEKDAMATANEIASNRKDIGNANDNLDLFKRNHSLFSNVTGKFTSSGLNLIKGVAGAVDYGLEISNEITGLDGANSLLQGVTENLSKGIQTDIDGINSRIEKPLSIDNVNSLSDFGDWLVGDVAAPQIPIFALTATGVGGVAAIGVTSTGQKFEEMKSEMEKGKKYSKTELLLNPFGYGLAETASAGVDLILLKNAGRVIQSATQPERSMIAKGMWDRIKTVGKDYALLPFKSASIEAVDEGATQVMENYIDKKPLFEGVKDASLAGFVMGKAIGVGGVLVKDMVKPFTTDTKIQKGYSALLNLQNQLDLPGLDIETKKILQENYTKTKEKVEGLVLKVVGDVNSLSNAQFQEINTLERAQQNIRNQAEKIKLDDNLSEEMQSQILSNLKEEFNANNQRRIDLLERGSNVQLEKLDPKEVIRLKDAAGRELMKEQNPDGTKSITLEDNEISKRAVQIYNKEKSVSTEVQSVNTEPTPVVVENPIPPAPEGYNIVDNKPKEEVDVLKDAESTFKALGNLDTPWFDDFQNKFGDKYKTGKDVSEAYHKAKADGTNPELVKAVEGLLQKPSEAEKAETPEAKIEKQRQADLNDKDLLKYPGKEFTSYDEEGYRKMRIDDINKKYDADLESLKNEATPPSNPPTNGNLPIGANNVEQNGNAEQQNNPGEKVQNANDGGNVEGEDKIEKNITFIPKKETIKDDKGNPITFYHGSNNEFSDFDESMLGLFTGADSAKEGFFFTDNKSVANSYRQQAIYDSPNTEGLKEVLNGFSKEEIAKLGQEVLGNDAKYYYGDLSKQESIDDIVDDVVKDVEKDSYYPDRNKYIEKISKYLKEKDIILKPYLDKGQIVETHLDIKNPKIIDAGQEKAEDIGLAKMIKEAKEQGHDGVIIKNIYDSVSFEEKGNDTQLSSIVVVFDKKQINLKNKPTETPQPKSKGNVEGENASEITTKRVKSKTFANKESEYDVDFDTDGNIKEIRSVKDGRIIPKFVERKSKTKFDKNTGEFKKVISINANWSKIEASSKGELTKNQADALTKEERNKKVSEALSNFTPTNEYEAALEALAKGAKVSRESLKKETGNKDNNWATDKFSKVKLPSIEKLSEIIWGDSMKDGVSELDQTEIRNALIDIITSNQSIQQVQDEIIENYSENNKRAKEQELNAFLGSLSEKDFAMYQALQAEEDYFEELTDKETYEYFNEKYNEYEQGQREYARQEAFNEKPKDITPSNERQAGIEGENKKTTGQKVKIIFGPFGEFGGDGILLENGDVELNDGETIKKNNINSIQNIEGKSAEGEVKPTNNELDNSDLEADNEQYSEQDRSSKLYSERIIPEKRTALNSPKKLNQIIKDVAQKLKANVIYSKSKRRLSLGSYSPSNAAVKIGRAGDLDTVAHEIGHFLDDSLNILSYIPQKIELAVIKQLKWFSERGGSNPPSQLTRSQKAEYLEREGLAEFIRAYVANPTQAKIFGPELFDYFENHIGEENTEILKEFSKDFIDYANSDAGDRIIANVNTIDLKDKNGFVEWIKSLGKNQSGKSLLEFNEFDKLRDGFTNAMHYTEQAFIKINQAKGVDVNDIKSFSVDKNFNYLSSMYRTASSSIFNKMKYGFLNEKGEQIKDGNERVNMEYLFSGLDSSTPKNLLTDINDVVKLLIAQRTLEYAVKFGRKTNLTNAGGGIFNDIDVAQEHLNNFDDLQKTDKSKFERITEGARRYRVFADTVLDIAVEKGLISKENLNDIKAVNQFYVALNRINESAPTEELLSVFNGSGNSLGNVKSVIVKAKGGSAFIEDPYTSLFVNSANILKQADKNQVLNSFFNPLKEIRGMGEGFPISFSEIAVPATTGDKETITLFVDGNKEVWRIVSKEIYESLKNLNAIQSNLLIDLAAIPANLIRMSVTKHFVFGLRNAFRDTFARITESRSNSGFSDFKYSKEDQEYFRLYGGSQEMHYLTDKQFHKKTIKESIKKLSDKNHVVLNPLKIAKAYGGFLAKTEEINRVAEFKSSFEYAKKQGLNDHQARLYAAYQAKDLMDFTRAGNNIRALNRIMPFLNAKVQGLARAKKALKEDPVGFAFKQAMYMAIPTLITAFIRSQMDDDDEYEQLPDYQRDLFWNFKTPFTGEAWVCLPKPHELGLPSSLLDRAISYGNGNKGAFSGFLGSTSKAVSVLDETSVLGGLKPVIEVMSNRDYFRDKNIIPAWEQDLIVEKRKGAKYASNIGEKTSMLLNKAGWTTDPRNVDHLLRGYGTYFADWAIATGDLGKEDSRNKFSISKTGFAKDQAIINSKSVMEATQLAKELNKFQSSKFKNFRDKIDSVYEKEEGVEKQNLIKEIYNQAKALKEKYKKEKKEFLIKHEEDLKKEKTTIN